MQNNTFSTLFIGQNLITLSAVDSTNNYLKGLLSNSEPLPEGTVIMADNQFAGRGQHSNSWVSTPGMNLTFSLYLKPSWLHADKQFFLNSCISIGIVSALRRYNCPGLKIKWPNDIYYNNKKLGGMLIENIISGTRFKQSIIGIGINVNQTDFTAEGLRNATSMAQILQKNVHLLDILPQICSDIEAVYLRLKAGHYTELQEFYVNNLYKINELSLYRQNGELFEGVIIGVSDSGLLRVMRAGKERLYNFKEIEFLNTTHEKNHINT